MDFSAIFAYNDMVALGVIQAIKEKDLRIPEDIGLVGYDDIPYSAFISPPLTTVKVKKAGSRYRKCKTIAFSYKR